jgi:hypothetical protein
METIDSAAVSGQNPKTTRVILVAIRVIRILTGVCLLVFAIKYSPLFIFLFDSPNVIPILIFGLLLSIPLSFAISEKAYKMAVAKGHFVKGLLYGAAPLLLLSLYSGIGIGIEKLTPAQRSHINGLIVLPDGEKLSINTPDICTIENFRIKFEINGKWLLSDDEAHFVCDSSAFGVDKLLIQEALSIPYNESLIRGNSMLIEKSGNYEVFLYENNGRDQFEITKFTAYDGVQVSVRRNLSLKSTPYRYVSRRLDDRFELTYGITQDIENRAAWARTDRNITEYVKSISHRNK